TRCDVHDGGGCGGGGGRQRRRGGGPPARLGGAGRAGRRRPRAPGKPPNPLPPPPPPPPRARGRHSPPPAAGDGVGRGTARAAGEPLVTTATGGMHGGGAQLTLLGRWAMTGFRKVQGNLGQTASSLGRQLNEQTPSALHVVAAVSLEEVLGQLLTDFAAVEPTLRVRTVFGASDELADNLLAGSPGHLFLTADPLQLDRLKAARLLLPGPAVSLAENGLAAVAGTDRDCSVQKPADLARDDAIRVAIAGP